MGFPGEDLLASLVGGGVSLAGQAIQNKWSAQQAAKQMQFQERMSSTAHQREVGDLRAAGLNPMLSVNAGASSPGGAMATGESPVVAGVSGAMAVRRLKGDLAEQTARIGVSTTQAELNKANAELARAGLPFKRGVGAVASDATSLYSALQAKIRGLIVDKPTLIPGSAQYQRPHTWQHSARQAVSPDAARMRVIRQTDRGVFPKDTLPFPTVRP